MLRSTRTLILLAIIVSAVALLCVPASAETWNYATDFSTTNPNGPWSYGCFDWTDFLLYNEARDWSGVLGCDPPSGCAIALWARSGSANYKGAAYKNVSGSTIYTTKAGMPCNIPNGSAGLFSGNSSAAYGSSIRFTAPSGGDYNIHAVFTDQRTDLNSSGIGIYLNSTGYAAVPIWADTIDNVDKVSTTYDATRTLAAGNTLDFVAGGKGTGTLTGMDITVTKAGSPGTLFGVVRSDAAGNPPVAGALIADGSGIYTATTAADGSYSMGIPSGDVTVTVSCANFDSQTMTVHVDNGQSVNRDFTLPAWSKFSGVVTCNSTPVEGVKIAVSGRTETATTAADGSYTLTVPAGTYDLTASKNGYDAVVRNSIVLAPQGITNTQDFALPLGALISGTVSDSSVGHVPMSGVSVATSTGVYSTTTDSAGHYALRVTHGNFTVVAKKAGYLSTKAAIDASGVDVAKDFVLNAGYDLAEDFSPSNNPNGPWSYGFSNGTAVPFARMEISQGDWNEPSWAQRWYTRPGDRYEMPGYGPTIVKNPTSQVGSYHARNHQPSETCIVEPLKCVIVPGLGVNTIDDYAYNDVRKAIVRFSAPTAGAFDIKAVFTAATKSSDRGSDGTDCGVMILKNGVPLYGDPATDPKRFYSAFVGTSSENYTDSFGTETVLSYDATIDIAYGDIIDAVVYNPGDICSGWAGIDLTLSAGSSAIVGHVSCDNLPGEVVGATVRAIGPSVYSTVTDANGNYALYVKPGTYRVEAVKTNYALSKVLGVVVALDATVTQNMVLHHNGTWDLVADYSTLMNPSGQWSYGSVDGQNVMTPFTLTDRRLGSDTLTWYDGEHCWFGVNTSSVPVIYSSWPTMVNTIAPGKASFGGGGGRNYFDTVRWTAPRTGYYNIDSTVAYQCVDEMKTRTGWGMTIRLNGSDLVTLNPVRGFKGTVANSYADSYAPGPAVPFNGIIPMNSGDTLDFVIGNETWDGHSYGYGWPTASLDLWAQVSEVANAVTCASVANLRSAVENQPVGTQVVLTTPSQLSCGTYRYYFGRAFNGVPETSFAIQGDDRANGVKCVATGTLPEYNTSNKVTVAGTVAVDALGQRVLAAGAIVGSVASTETKPIGKTSKSLAAANKGTLVKVWGKIKSIVVNTSADASEFYYDETNDPGHLIPMRKWDYEYMVISDGGVDVKIPMHVQASYMPNTDSQLMGLEHKDASGNYDHYIAVTGVLGTSTGTDLVVYPRSVNDIMDYTVLGL